MRSHLLWFLFILSCPAHSVVISADQGQVSGARIDGIRWQIDGDTHRLDIKRLQFEDLALDGQALTAVCRVTEGPRCNGTLKGKSWPKFELSAQWPEQIVRLSWPDGALTLGLPEAGLAIHSTALPLAWLKPRANRSWNGLAALEGTLDLDLLISEPDWRGEWRAHGLSFDQDDGQIAGASVEVGGTIRYQVPSSLFELDANLTSGELLVGPLYRKIGPPLRIAADMDLSKPSLVLQRLEIVEGKHLALTAAATFNPDGEPVRITLDRLDLSWPDAQPWIDPILASAGYPGLLLAGDAKLSGLWEPGGWQSGEAALTGLSVSDPQGRVEASGLILAAHLGESVPASSLHWSALKMFGLPLSAGQFDWQWQPEKLAQIGKTRVEVLGGAIGLSGLTRVGGRWQGSLAIDQLDFAALSERFGWPAFGGRISANLSNFDLYDGQINLPGEIVVRAFDGEIGIKNLATERLLGDSPALAADVRMKSLDLSQVTAAMSFGEIQGRMDGYINGLRLLDWSPIAFDARLQTIKQSGVKQRISRRAVEGLSRIGGAGLNNALIGLVDSFGYADLGIACRLKEDVCTMDGVDSDGRGYTIVKGSGIPRLTVNGYQRQVDWPVMVRRLKAAASGSGPIID